jgi:hypothetical protein
MSCRPNKQTKHGQNISISTNDDSLSEFEQYNYKKVLIETWGYYFNLLIDFTFTTIKFIIRVCGIYLLWIVLHYASSHLYIKLCVPSTVVGFLISPFMIATPQCQGLRWIVYNAASIINNMWILMGAWICSLLLITTSGDSPHMNR